MILLTNTPDAPRAKALKTSVPRLTPPSKKTGIIPRVALTTCNKRFQQNYNLRMFTNDDPTKEMKSPTPVDNVTLVRIDQKSMKAEISRKQMPPLPKP